MRAFTFLVAAVAAAAAVSAKPADNSLFQPRPTPAAPTRPGPGGITTCPVECKDYPAAPSGQKASSTTPLVCQNRVDASCLVAQGKWDRCDSNYLKCAQQGVIPTPRPPAPPSLYDTLANMPEVSKFVALVTANRLDFILKSGRPGSAATVFVPNNDAISAVESILTAANTVAVLKNHIVIAAAPVMSKDLVQGGEYRTLDNQQVLTSQNSDGGWRVANQDKSIIGDVLIPDIKGDGGNAGTGVVESVAHVISKVLVPVVAKDVGTKCTDAADTCQVVPDWRCTNLPKPSGAGSEDCAPGTLTTIQENGQCCKDTCITYRHQKGTGAVCERSWVRPTPSPPAPPTLPPCPQSCKSNFDNCRNKYQNPDSCLAFAARGQLCSGAGTATAQCDAKNFIKGGGAGDCESGQSLQCIPEVCAEALSCENADNKDLQLACKEAWVKDPKQQNCDEMCMCNKGFFWDNALGECTKQCPSGDACEAVIEQDYLEAGNRQGDCKETAVGSTCKTSCASFTCLSKPGFSDREDKYCAQQKDEKACDSRICNWVGAGGAGPTFVCEGDFGQDARWTISDPGHCDGGGGGAMEACEYFRESQCLVSSECSASNWQNACMDVVRATMAQCQGQCFNSKVTNDEECSGCIFDELMKSDGVNPGETDATACCPCLDDAFAKQGVDMNADEINQIMLSGCQMQPDANDD